MALDVALSSTNYWMYFQSAKVQQLDPVYPLDAEIEQKKAQMTKEKSISRS